jgi:hypothetical protein
MRLKQEELVEMSLRRDLLEKRVETLSKEREVEGGRMGRKVEDLQALLHRKEREFREGLDQFQKDIDALEKEKAELKERMKALIRKSGGEGGESRDFGDGEGGEDTRRTLKTETNRYSFLGCLRWQCCRMGIVSDRKQRGPRFECITNAYGFRARAKETQ